MRTAVSPLAEALGRAHATLMADLQTLEAAARPARAEGPPGLREVLRATRKHLVEHFRFEERNGYMDAVRERAPHLEKAVRELAHEQRVLKGGLDALIEESASSGRDDEALGAKILDWVEHVRRHEARENDLVQDAFNLDISAED